MHNEAQAVLVDVLMACRTINVFGDLAVQNLENHISNDLTEREKDELNRAFKLMQQTLNCVQPLINATAIRQLHAV